MEEFLNSSLFREISNLLKCTSIPVPEDSFAGPLLILEWSVLLGHVCVLSIRDDEFSRSGLIEITDEKLLEQLRSVSGQFTDGRHPVVYYEHLMSTADYNVYAKTGQLPT